MWLDLTVGLFSRENSSEHKGISGMYELLVYGSNTSAGDRCRLNCTEQSLLVPPNDIYWHFSIRPHDFLVYIDLISRILSAWNISKIYKLSFTFRKMLCHFYTAREVSRSEANYYSKIHRITFNDFGNFGRHPTIITFSFRIKEIQKVESNLSYLLQI